MRAMPATCLTSSMWTAHWLEVHLWILMNSLPLYRQENNKQQTFVAHLEMNYIEYKFTIHPNSPWTEILLAKLSESDFESFEETDEGLNAYVKTGFEDEEFVKTQLEGIQDRKSTRLNSSHVRISYAVFCLKKKK